MNETTQTLPNSQVPLVRVPPVPEGAADTDAPPSSAAEKQVKAAAEGPAKSSVMLGTLAERGVLHADATPARLHLYVKLLFAIWFARYLFDPLPLLSRLPLAYADGVGWLRLLPLRGMELLYSPAGLYAVKYGLLACCVGTWFARLRLPAALVGCVLLTTLNAIVRSFGHVNHSELGPLLVTWVLSLFLFRAGGQWKSTLLNPQHRWWHRPHPAAAMGLGTAVIVLGLVYAGVGLARIFGGGAELFTGETIGNHVLRASHSPWVAPWNFSRWVVGTPWLSAGLQLGTLAVTGVELLVPFSLVSTRIRWLIWAALPGFHIGAMFLFKVFFIEQILTLLLLVPLPWMLAWAQPRRAAVR